MTFRKSRCEGESAPAFSVCYFHFPAFVIHTLFFDILDTLTFRI